MNAPYIKVSIITHATKEADHTAYFLASHCLSIHTATAQDRKQRSEINAIIMTPTGGYAVAESPATILLKLQQAASDIPAEE